MKKIIMMMAIVGMSMSTFAQELTDDYKKQSIEASNAFVESNSSNKSIFLSSMAKKTNGIDVSYPYVKEVLRHRYGKAGDTEDLEHLINSNPTMVNHFKTSESYLYSLGLSKREIQYLKEYMSSDKK